MWEGDKLEAAFITANHNFYRELIFFSNVFPNGSSCNIAPGCIIKDHNYSGADSSITTKLCKLYLISFTIKLEDNLHKN
jgi:hypothetical protein